MPRMWNQHHANPLGLKVLTLKWASNNNLLSANIEQNNAIARSIIRQFQIFAFPMSQQQLNNELSPCCCGVVILIDSNGIITQEAVCESVSALVRCVPTISFDEEVFSSKLAQEAILYGIQNTLTSQGWSQLGNKHKLERLWVRNIDFENKKSTLDAVKLELLFSSSTTPGTYQFQISLEALKLTMRKWGSGMRGESPEVFLLPELCRAIACEDQQTSSSIVAARTTAERPLSTDWFDGKKLIKEDETKLEYTRISVPIGNVEDGDISEHQYLIPKVFLLCEEPTEKLMSKAQGGDLLRQFKQLLVLAGFPKCIENEKHHGGGGLNDNVQDSSGWVKSSGLSRSAPLWTNGKGLRFQNSMSHDGVAAVENEQPLLNPQAKIMTTVSIELESILSKLALNCPTFPDILNVPFEDTSLKNKSSKIVVGKKLTTTTKTNNNDSEANNNKKKRKKILGEEESRTPLADLGDGNSKAVVNQASSSSHSVEQRIENMKEQIPTLVSKKKPRSKKVTVAEEVASQVVEEPPVLLKDEKNIPSLPVMKKMKLNELKALCLEANIKPLKTKAEIMLQLASLCE